MTTSITNANSFDNNPINRLQHSLNKLFNNSTKIDEKWLRKILELHDEEKSEGLASSLTQEEIRKEIELIIGPENEWRFDSEQAQQFREKCIKLREKSVEEMDIIDVISNQKTISYDFKYERDQTQYVHPVENDTNMTQYLNLWDLVQPTRVEIIGIENLNIQPEKSQSGNSYLYICCELFHGGTPLTKGRFTRMIPLHTSPQWNQFVIFNDVLLCDLPRETKICFTIFSRQMNETDQSLDSPNCISGKDTPLGYVIIPMFDFKGLLKQGEFHSIMKPNGRAMPYSIPIENIGNETSIFINYRLDSHSDSVVFPQGKPPKRMEECLDSFEQNIKEFFKDLPQEEQLNQIINQIITRDSLQNLTQEERWLLWSNREVLIEIPKALPKFILSVPWKMPHAVHIAHSLLSIWKPISPLDALELLSYKFADSKVRQYAIERLDELDDAQLSDFLLQLVQSLKYEPYHDSSLSRFLLERSLRSPHTIGHFVFWHLKADMHVPSFKERFCLILEEYLSNSGNHRRELLKQVFVLDQLLEISIKIKQEKLEDCKSTFEKLINNVKLPKKFKLPISPHMEVTEIIPHKCKFMDTKHRGLWLCFKNADKRGDNIHIIFKAGDDLRSDQLIVQLLRVMDKLWKKEGLDLHLKPYASICTGELIGMIEIVKNSETVAHIVKGSGHGIARVFNSDIIHDWLKMHNHREDEWNGIVDNFVRSCAAYCPATYVLGVGDRHNDNIMVTRKGDLFHIDFTYFLGCFRYHFVRESTPFIFNPMHSHVMGGENSEMFEKFCELSCQSYACLCKYGQVIITLFILMLGADIPHLKSIENVMWLKKSLMLNGSKEYTDKHFRSQIKESMRQSRARIGDAIHIFPIKR
ncbi:predicted protein [Naegleria gruberi]|uniref:phosphatidylinositol 3-kinase n=1 Tax=Naegleria gruberi TaxID=5762 RepID=D2VCM0_NAEGR|nr:uncharacterized protein NAEGRDRAFT_48457 [Naegleria gruberi]EFC45331.1 predicted protein [Naegleria gruberi]|eukprot:XP_002678075.1 predicted protein [Naegleria gruberi strain NEG-M]